MADGLSHLADALGDIPERLIWIGPLGHRLRVGGQSLYPGKWCPLPIHRAQMNRHYPGFTCLMSCEPPPHLDVVAVVGVKKIGADQEQNQLSRFQVLVDRILPGAAGSNLAVVPGLNDPLPLQETQVLLHAR